MKIILAIGIGLFILNCYAQNDNASIRTLLLEQSKHTHNKEGWFAPINVALDGVTSDQSNWRDNSENHSIGQLVSHLIFWNEQVLNAFDGNTLPNFNDDNSITFNQYEGEQWALTIKKLDSIQAEWERKVQSASDEQLKEWSSNIANVCSHNAYHIGQIIYIRKRNGWLRKTE